MKHRPVLENDPAPRAAMFVLLAPVVLHVVALGMSVNGGPIRFGRLDLALAVGALLYVGIAAYASRRRVLAYRLVAVTYSIIAVVCAAECGLLALGTPVQQAIPSQPQVRQFDAEVVPGVVQNVQYSINDLGLRAPQEAPGTHDVRILCIGGSTTECFYTTDQQTWPWLMQTKLSQRLGKSMYVGNAGKAGHATLEHLEQIKHYKYLDEFDWIVVLSGINDLLLTLHDSYETRFKRAPTNALVQPAAELAYYRASQLGQCVDRILYPPSLDNAVIMDVYGSWLSTGRDMRQQALAKRTLTELPSNMALGLERYRKDLTNIIAAARQRGKQIVMMTQPTLWADDLVPQAAGLLWITQDESSAYAAEVLREGMNRYNAVMRAVCQAQDVPCIDLAQAIPPDPRYFFDDCHFTTRGCQKVADLVTDFFLTQLETTAAQHTPSAPLP